MRERGRELVESRRCGGCYVLAQRPRSKLVSTRGEEEGGKGGRLESPLAFIPGHLPKDIIIVLKQVRDILPSFGYGVQMVRLKYIESERESSFIHHYPLIHANLNPSPKCMVDFKRLRSRFIWGGYAKVCFPLPLLSTFLPSFLPHWVNVQTRLPSIRFD